MRDEMDDLYASHLPVLSAIGKAARVCSVIEFGSGHYSTPFFLSRGNFPLLEKLVSVETDKGWAAKCMSDDPRHSMLVCESEREVISDLGGHHFDLAFVDGPLDTRPGVISAVSPLAPVVVVHDAEAKALNERIMDTYRFVYLFAAWKDAKAGEHNEPWTAICTDDKAISAVIASIGANEVMAGRYV